MSTPQPAPVKFPVKVTSYGTDTLQDGTPYEEIVIELPTGHTLHSQYVEDDWIDDDHDVYAPAKGDAVPAKNLAREHVMGEALDVILDDLTEWAITNHVAVDLATRGIETIVAEATQAVRDAASTARQEVNFLALESYVGYAATGTTPGPHTLVDMLASASSILDAYAAASGRSALGDLSLLGDLTSAKLSGTLHPDYTTAHAAMVDALHTGLDSEPGHIIRGADRDLGHLLQGEADAAAEWLVKMNLTVGEDD